MVHLYAASPEDATLALVAAAEASPRAPVRVHVEAAAGRGATARPVLMAMLAEAAPGDVVCGDAALFTSAPPRARSRLATVVKTRGVGLALLGDPASMAQLTDGVATDVSRHAALRVTAPRTPVAPMLGRAAAAAAVSPADMEMRVLQLLHGGRSWRQVQTQIGASRAVVAKCAQRLAAVESAQSHAAFAASRVGGRAPGERTDDGDSDLASVGV